MAGNVKRFRKYSFTLGGFEPDTDDVFESPQKVTRGSRVVWGSGNLPALWVIICSSKSLHGDEVRRLTACHG
jgi:hypothetical protein